MRQVYLRVIGKDDKAFLIKIDEGYVYLQKAGKSSNKFSALLSKLIIWMLYLPSFLSNLLFYTSFKLKLADHYRKIKFVDYNMAGLFMYSKRGIDLISCFTVSENKITEKRINKVLNGDEVVILKPKYTFNKSVLRSRIVGYLDKPHNIWSLLLLQPIKQLFGVWLGKTNKFSDYKMYCQEHVSYIHFEAFKLHENVTPTDIINNHNFKIVWSGKIKDCEIVVR
jgi:hypothetical protein